MGEMSLRFSLYLVTLCQLLCRTLQEEDYLYSFTGDEVLEIVENACFIAGSATEHGHLLNSLAPTFAEEEAVKLGFINVDTFKWPSKDASVFSDTNGNTDHLKKSLILFKKIIKDRICLLAPTHLQKTPKYIVHSGQMSPEIVTDFINQHCETFRLFPDGRLSNAGLHRNYILENLFHVQHVSDVNMRDLYQSKFNPLNSSFVWNDADLEQQSCQSEFSDCKKDTKEPKFMYHSKHPHPEMAQCERLKIPPTQEEFFNNYLKRSRPFILENATNQWPAFHKWTNEFLTEKFGNKTVHIKMTPSGDYEGVESADLWENFETFTIPEKVKSQLKYPDIVVVRPAAVTMKFSKFIDLINETAQLPVQARDVSAYLEYTSLAEYFDNLEADIIEPAFAKQLLSRQHLNIWLSDGNTLGRLHFDPFDNLLCQLAGKKEVILFEPHDNQKLYEAHIPQAELSFDKTSRKFRRKTLQDTTALVMSPVDIRNPSLKRFPKFLDAQPMNCTISEGDILFIPAFWWHEVQSFPSVENPRNLAVNFWYEPFLTKEFPCEECPMDVNPAYFDKLN